MPMTDEERPIYWSDALYDAFEARSKYGHLTRSADTSKGEATEIPIRCPRCNEYERLDKHPEYTLDNGTYLTKQFFCLTCKKDVYNFGPIDTSIPCMTHIKWRTGVRKNERSTNLQQVLDYSVHEAGSEEVEETEERPAKKSRLEL